jgi:hypothetical protein
MKEETKEKWEARLVGLCLGLLFGGAIFILPKFMRPTPADWRPRPEVVVEPYGSKNGTPEPAPTPTPIAWTEAEKRIIEAIQKLDAVNAAQNEAIGKIVSAFAPSGVIDDGTTNTLHAGPKGGFELKARK